MIIEYTNKKGEARKWVLQMFLFSGLRRMSYRTPMRAAAMTKARISRGKYKCAECGLTFGRKAIAIDHKEPVVNPITGFTTFDEYITRLFCPTDGLQVLCNKGKESCHKKKSKAENKIRIQVRKNKNEES